MLGLRQLSFQESVQQASQRMRTALEAPGKAMRTVQRSVGQATAAVYSKMPRQVWLGGRAARLLEARCTAACRSGNIFYDFH